VDVTETPDARVPLVTPAEFDLDLVAPATRFISLTVDTGEQGMQKMRFPMRGDLSIPEVARLRRIERTLEDATSQENGEAALLDAFEELHAMITTLVLEKTPDAPELKITYQQAMPLLSWLSGDASFADKIARTLTDGQTGAKTAEEASEGEAAVSADDVDADGSGLPLVSRGLSQTASSGSDGSTGGGRAGGTRPAAPPTVSLGPSSGRTSETPALA
jgi:hypothetical protein